MKFLGAIKKEGVVFEQPKELDSSYQNRRTAVRFIVFNGDGKIALNHRPAQFGYKEQNSIPGGGVMEQESIEDALRREAMEEIGCSINDIKEIGYTLEYNDDANQIQTTYFFEAVVDGEQGQPQFTDKEKETNLGVIWLPFDEAVAAVKQMSFGYAQTRSLLALN